MENRLRILRPNAAGRRPTRGELHISRQSVNAIQTGKYDPSLPLSFRLARLFGIPIEAIFSEALRSGFGSG